MYGNAKEKYGARAGVYSMNDNNNGWVSGKYAIWYSETDKAWLIGYEKYLGTDKGGIMANGNTKCPPTMKTTNSNQWTYYDKKNKEWLDGNNEIEVVCGKFSNIISKKNLKLYIGLFAILTLA